MSAGAYPAWLPRRYRGLWDHPWRARARHTPGFKRLLWRHGYVSPNFTRDETRCNDAARTAPPKSMKKGVQRQAFKLEQLRHELGDFPLRILSWFRTLAHNIAVGGASGSKHLEAIAGDIDSGQVAAIGHDRFFAAARKVYFNGGIGVYPSGAAHVDARGYFATWTSF